jgi:predicted metal-dependent phosphoesterase TrpH
LFVDLHIHSCLSPCADDDMTPANICGMAHIKGLDAIAVTDHNTGRNLPYVKEAADYYGLIFLPGMEITTKEEVHLLGYFRDVDTAVEVGEIFSNHLPPMKNKPDFFGNQLVMNTDDEVVAVEDRLLIGATDLDLAECTRIIREHGGAAVPAHINRGHGLLVNLGLFPEEPVFPVVEVRPELAVNEKLIAGKSRLWSSDAHHLGDILEAVSELDTDRFSLGGLFDFINGRNKTHS